MHPPLSLRVSSPFPPVFPLLFPRPLLFSLASPPFHPCIPSSVPLLPLLSPLFSPPFRPCPSFSPLLPLLSPLASPPPFPHCFPSFPPPVFPPFPPCFPFFPPLHPLLSLPCFPSFCTCFPSFFPLPPFPPCIPYFSSLLPLFSPPASPPYAPFPCLPSLPVPTVSTFHLQYRTTNALLAPSPPRPISASPHLRLAPSPPRPISASPHLCLTPSPPRPISASPHLRLAPSLPHPISASPHLCLTPSQRRAMENAKLEGEKCVREGDIERRIGNYSRRSVSPLPHSPLPHVSPSVLISLQSLFILVPLIFILTSSPLFPSPTPTPPPLPLLPLLPLPLPHPLLAFSGITVQEPKKQEAGRPWARWIPPTLPSSRRAPPAFFKVRSPPAPIIQRPAPCKAIPACPTWGQPVTRLSALPSARPHPLFALVPCVFAAPTQPRSSPPPPLPLMCTLMCSTDVLTLRPHFPHLPPVPNPPSSPPYAATTSSVRPPIPTWSTFTSPSAPAPHSVLPKLRLPPPLVFTPLSVSFFSPHAPYLPLSPPLPHPLTLVTAHVHMRASTYPHMRASSRTILECGECLRELQRAGPHEDEDVELNLLRVNSQWRWWGGRGGEGGAGGWEGGVGGWSGGTGGSMGQRGGGEVWREGIGERYEFGEEIGRAEGYLGVSVHVFEPKCVAFSGQDRTVGDAAASPPIHSHRRMPLLLPLLQRSQPTGPCWR
ncbi:unnamed protein product [Closterium sp. NIES-64]|nr:unnamed protein product [Closterium sp. NIES-64]